MKKNKSILAAAAIAAASILGGSIATASGGRDAPAPTPVGPVFKAPAIGKSVTVTLTPTTKIAAADSGWHPTEEVTTTRSTYTPPPAGSVTVKLTTAAAATAVSGCNTGKVKVGMSLLWASMSQTWCYANGYINYWPAAYCTGYDNYPTYNYEGCSTSQIYGYGWNQGRTYWHASNCYVYIPLWGACTARDTYNRTYYYAPNGSWFQI